MGQFFIDRKNDGGKVVLTLNGQIDEDASFSGAILDGIDQLVLDLEKIDAINSCGIREWIKWIQSAPSQCKIEFRNCPKVIIDQINMVKGFLPENAIVESFYVPFYSEETGKEKMILFRRGLDFNEQGVTADEEITCEESGETLEMDILPTKYFKFLIANES